MFGITDLATYTIGTIFIILLPGPNSLYVLAMATRCGVRAGYAATAGIMVGDTLLMVLAAAGVGSLLAAYPKVFNVLKYAGGAYLVWLGINLILSAVQRWMHGPIAPVPVATETARDISHPFRRALFISLLNPKAILFLISFFIQFVDPGYAYPALTFIALGAIVQFFSIIYLSALIFVGARLADAFRTRYRLAAAINGGVGALFIGFGAKLATTSVE